MHDTSEKIVFLILAHRDPRLVARLIQRLKPHPIVIHVDARVDVDEFRRTVAEYSIDPRQVSYTRRRIKIAWGGYSMVRAMMVLAESGIDAFPGSRHYVFLSGQCYPIRPVEEFAKHLEDLGDTQLVRAFPLGPPHSWHTDRLTKTHIFDFGRFLPSNVLTANALRLLRGTVRLLAIRRSSRSVRGTVEASGSQWMALTQDCLSDVIARYRGGTFDRYRHAFAPDEMAIQSYVFNSPWAKQTLVGRLEDNPSGKVSALPNYHHLNQEMSGAFTSEQFEEIACSQHYFVRKVDSDTSGTLLDLIDRELLRLS